ncbi:MAG: CheR family methyltransferase [Syntrophobacteraceae bacterium]
MRKGVKKRIADDMHEHGLRNVSDYLLYLNSSPHAKRKAEELLTVSISRFFRDLRLWDVIGGVLIPEMARKVEAGESGTVRAWSAGCARGEEAYSFKILWDRAEREAGKKLPLEMWGTDTNPEVLERARAGLYSRSSLRDAPPTVLRDYFTSTPDGFSLREEVKRGMHWARHDFVSEDPPASGFNIILLRNNLLTYYEQPLRTAAFSKIQAALSDGGFLIIGGNEWIPGDGFPLKPRPENRNFFEKIPGRDRGHAGD